jgi:hypothetical protein
VARTAKHRLVLLFSNCSECTQPSPEFSCPQEVDLGGHVPRPRPGFAEYITTTGAAAARIVKAAKENDADLLVMSGMKAIGQERDVCMVLPRQMLCLQPVCAGRCGENG